MVSEASDLRIRFAVQKDIPFLMQLRNRFLDVFLSGEKATPEGTRALLPEMYVAEIDDKPVGAFSLYNCDPLTNSIEFGRFILEPLHRRRGYGQAMLRYAIQQAREQHFAYIVLTIKPGNVPADALYRDEGFCVTHTAMELKL